MNRGRRDAAARPAYAPTLPALARTRGGATFDPRAELWSYRDGVIKVHIEFASTLTLSAEMKHALKATLLWYAENSSASHLINMHTRFQHLAEFLAQERSAAIEEVTSTDLLNYKTSLADKVAWYLGSLSGLLKKWHGLGLPGVTDDAVAALGELRLKGNAKGVAVLTMDPLDGPYTEVEQQAIQSALNDAYAQGSLAEDAYLLTWLFMALGQRPSQYASLKVCDISAVSCDGRVAYTLKVPRAKQRNAHPRAEFKARPLVSQIGRPLLDYARRVRQRFEGRIDDANEAPMFPANVAVEGVPGYAWHQTSKALSSGLNWSLSKLAVRSERTGGTLHITPVRFRRTFGTRAAQEGHGELVIAELLDHTDTQNVGVYVAAVPEIAARIDRAVAMALAPLAQAFKGVLITGEGQATRGSDPSSRIVDLRIDHSMRPMGSCGQHAFCSFSAPIACYTCRSFEPWLDGPHDAVLTHLLDKREQLLATTDERIAAVNDRTILAVAQVIQLCRDTRASAMLSDG